MEYDPLLVTLVGATILVLFMYAIATLLWLMEVAAIRKIHRYAPERFCGCGWDKSIGDHILVAHSHLLYGETRECRGKPVMWHDPQLA